ncbi:MAG: hypothetical protein AAFX78_02395 [Cyanobacteria bacterium J06638_20]
MFKSKKPNDRVVLVDERHQVVRTRKVSDADKKGFYLRTGQVWTGPDVIPLLDKRGRKILDTKGSEVVLQGRELHIKTKRAMRWIKANPPGSGKRMPRHIEYGARALEHTSGAVA